MAGPSRSAKMGAESGLPILEQRCADRRFDSNERVGVVSCAQPQKATTREKRHLGSRLSERYIMLRILWIKHLATLG
jgi:hypothetical protein